MNATIRAPRSLQVSFLSSTSSMFSVTTLSQTIPRVRSWLSSVSPWRDISVMKVGSKLVDQRRNWTHRQLSYLQMPLWTWTWAQSMTKGQENDKISPRYILNKWKICYSYSSKSIEKKTKFWSQKILYRDQLAISVALLFQNTTQALREKGVPLSKFP